MKFESVLFALTAIVGSVNLAHATVTFSGTALISVPGVSDGDTVVFLADSNNEGFLSFDVQAGAPLAENSTYGNFDVLSVKTASVLLQRVMVSGSILNIVFDDQLGAGDAFAVLVFGDSSTSAIAGDFYRIWTHPTWVLPPDGASVSFSTAPIGASFQQLRATDSPVRVATVIPEPASFSSAVGGLGLALMGLRRRRRV